MKIKPLGEYIYIDVKKVEEVKGIAVPDMVQNDEETVEEIITVLAVGEDCKVIKVGDRVVPIPRSGFGIPIGGEKKAFIKESNIMAVVT